jgi:hypothetical protein
MEEAVKGTGGAQSAPSSPPVSPRGFRVRITSALHRDIVVDGDLTVTHDWTSVPASKIEIIRRTARLGGIRIEEEEVPNG